MTKRTIAKAPIWQSPGQVRIPANRITRSGGNRSVIPKDSDHLFRRKPIACSGGIGSGVLLSRSEATRVIQLSGNVTGCGIRDSRGLFSFAWILL